MTCYIQIHGIKSCVIKGLHCNKWNTAIEMVGKQIEVDVAFLFFQQDKGKNISTKLTN